MKIVSYFVFFLYLTFGVFVMAEPKKFVCVQEKNNLPVLDPIADAWYREAVHLAKPDTIRPWHHIVDLYTKAVERGHWKAMHNLAELYRTGWPGGVEKDTQKTLDLYQRMIDLGVPQGFYNMGAMIGNRAGVKNPATDGLNFIAKAAQLGNPAALTQLGKLYIFETHQDELGLQYYHCAASQGHAEASYRIGSYYQNVKHNFPVATRHYQTALSQGNINAALVLELIFDETSLPSMALWYAPDEVQRKLYSSLHDQLTIDPDLRFPTLIKDHPLPAHPTQGYDAERPDWKPN